MANLSGKSDNTVNNRNSDLIVKTYLLKQPTVGAVGLIMLSGRKFHRLITRLVKK